MEFAQVWQLIAAIIHMFAPRTWIELRLWADFLSYCGTYRNNLFTHFMRNNFSDRLHFPYGSLIFWEIHKHQENCD